MKNNKINYFVVGIFVLGILTSLIVTLTLLSGGTGATDPYSVVYKNVTGVSFGTQVLYEGYPIGQVEDIIPIQKDGKMMFRVNVVVLDGWKIPDDSIAKIAAPGLLAAVSVNIRAGDSKTALQTGSEIIGRAPSDMFAVVSSLAETLGEVTESKLSPMLDSFNRAATLFGDLLEDDGKSLVKETNILIKQVRELVTYVTDRAPGIVDDVETFAENINITSKDLRHLVRPENQKKLELFLENMDKAAANFAALTKDLDASRAKFDHLFVSMSEIVDENRADTRQAIKDLRHVMDTLARNIDSVTQNIDATARNLNEFSRQIRQNPALLLSSQAPKDNSPKRKK